MALETDISEQDEQAFEKSLQIKIKEFNNIRSPYHREARKPGSSTPLHIMLRDGSGQYVCQPLTVLCWLLNPSIAI